MKLISWNLNGIRAAYKKGVYQNIIELDPDIFCVQETKAQLDQLSEEQSNIDGYNSYFHSAKRKGYSGVAIFSKDKPLNIVEGMGNERFDDEGRVITAEYENFKLYNVYFPNGKASKERLEYKMDFYNEFLSILKKDLLDGKNVIFCGDVNTAHSEIDLARPKENEKTSGFLPMERKWIDEAIDSGFSDSFRLLNPEGQNYTWWDLKTRARERNIGWRIDYFFISDSIKEKIISAAILKDIQGSDHCPIEIELDI